MNTIIEVDNEMLIAAIIIFVGLLVAIITKKE